MSQIRLDDAQAWLVRTIGILGTGQKDGDFWRSYLHTDLPQHVDSIRAGVAASGASDLGEALERTIKELESVAITYVRPVVEGQPSSYRPRWLEDKVTEAMNEVLSAIIRWRGNGGGGDKKIGFKG